MDPGTFITIFLGFHIMLYFLHSVLKSCMQHPYGGFLQSRGLDVQFLRLTWHTNAFNRLVLRCGSLKGYTRSWINISYALGVIVALSLLPLGIIAIFLTIFNTGEVEASQAALGGKATTSVVNLEILLPGVNLPLKQMGYYIGALFSATVVHELGHAVAAVFEDVPVSGFGLKLYFCFPLAYTEVSADNLNALKWFKKLRVLCAGIWHNVLYALLCMLLLSTMDYITAPLYVFNKGVIVTEMTHNSPLRAGDGKGISEQQIIEKINDCDVYNEDTWYGCLVESIRHKPAYCISSEFIRLNDESIDISHHGRDGVLQCCDKRNEWLSCFEYIDDLSNDAPVEIPQHVCLDISHTIRDSYGYCKKDGSCDLGFCLRPLLRNTTTILHFQRRAFLPDEMELHDVIYMGRPGDVARTVFVSRFVPKQQILGAEWGDACVLFLKYNIVFSMSLALLNAVPCFGLDGFHITNTIINSFLVNRVAERAKRDVIAMIVTSIGTLFFVLAFLKVLWLSLVRHML